MGGPRRLVIQTIPSEDIRTCVPQALRHKVLRKSQQAHVPGELKVPQVLDLGSCILHEIFLYLI
jgi:hypothetical protein